MNLTYYLRRVEYKLFGFLSKFIYVGNTVNLINGIKSFSVKPKTNKFEGIIIFYHLYLINNWNEIITSYLTPIIKSGLYEVMDEMQIGVIYHEDDLLADFIKLIEGYSKIHVVYYRKHNDLPVKIWGSPDVSINTNLGEGETILKMVEHAKKYNKNNCYIFLHSKGVTKPKNLDRPQMDYFYKLGLPKNSTNDEATKYITNKIIESVIEDWENKLDLMKKNNLYYYVWNIFYVRGSLLQRFNFKTFNENARFPKEFGLTNRHWSAIFPINLYESVYNKRFIQIQRIIDFAI